MEITIREKSDGPNVSIKKNSEVVAGTGITPDAQAEAPAKAEEEIKKVS